MTFVARWPAEEAKTKADGRRWFGRVFCFQKSSKFESAKAEVPLCKGFEEDLLQRKYEESE